jgi:hypothetical protein
MRRRDKYTLLGALGTGLLGTGLYLLRDRIADQIESVSDTAKDAYDTASGRIRRASQAITGEERSGAEFDCGVVAGSWRRRRSRHSLRARKWGTGPAQHRRQSRGIRRTNSYLGVR